jgi:sugar phosphate isomerase/epimerase
LAVARLESIVDGQRMKFGICNEIFKDWKIDDAMAFARKAGYDGIEIAPFTIAKYVTEIAEEERRRIRDVAAQVGIEITGIHWVLVQAEGMYLNHSDAEIRGRTAKYFCELVKFCADLGGKVIVVGSPKQRNVMQGVTVEQAWQWATETFRGETRRRSRHHDLF